MWNFLSKINKNLIIVIPVVMLLGFIYGIGFNSNFLKSLILPLTFLMVYPMMVTLNLKKLFESKDNKTQILTQLINFGIIPFIAFFTGKIFFAEKPFIALGLLLASLLPTSGMTISWTGFAKGNLEAAVKMTVIGLTLGSIATPFYIKWLMGTSIEVNIADIIKQIVIIVFIPMILGFITQQIIIKKIGQKEFKEKIAQRFSSASTLGVLGIVFVAIALKAKSLFTYPEELFLILTPLLGLYLFNYILSTFIGKLFLSRGDAIALVYGTVMRNLSIALAIAMNSFGSAGPDIALIISAAYIIQVQSAAWYVKFTDRIFGEFRRKESDLITCESK